MHFHLPKPLHGWREFAGEVGIIVLGILVALSAEQAVESWHWRNEMAQTRNALDAELGRNIAAFDWRWNQRPCIEARIDELDQWANSMAGPHPLKLRHEITLPIFVAIHTAVWKSTSGEISARMPVETRLDYATIYEAMILFDDNLSEEIRAWSDLKSYGQNRDLTREELDQVRRAIVMLRGDDGVLPAFRQRIDETAVRLGIRPKQHIEAGMEAQIAQPARKLCEPLLPKAG